MQTTFGLGASTATEPRRLTHSHNHNPLLPNPRHDKVFFALMESKTGPCRIIATTSHKKFLAGAGTLRKTDFLEATLLHYNPTQLETLAHYNSFSAKINASPVPKTPPRPRASSHRRPRNRRLPSGIAATLQPPPFEVLLFRKLVLGGVFTKRCWDADVSSRFPDGVIISVSTPAPPRSHAA